MTPSRKSNRDHAKKTLRPMVEDEVIADQLSALLTPAITGQENYYRQLGLRDRILNLPLMMAAVLTLLWRDVAGVTELTRMLAREGFLWCRPKIVSQQAISQRFLTFPYVLFEKVFKDLLPSLSTAWHSRKQRTLPESIQFTLTKFSQILIVDSSTLEALFCQLKSLEDTPKGQLAGKIGTVIDLMTRLPVEIWFQENPKASDTKLESNILNLVTVKTLLFYVAHQKGKATDPIKYFASPENQDLGIVKRQRKPNVKLIVAPFPEKQRSTDQFFFQAFSKILLTTALQP